MKRSKFTDEQILAIVKEREAGRKVADLCRANGVTEQTYDRWKAKYGGMELSEMQRLKQLDDENRRLKQIVAEQTLDIRALKAVVDDENNDREIESNSESENDLENWLGSRESPESVFGRLPLLANVCQVFLILPVGRSASFRPRSSVCCLLPILPARCHSK